MLVCGLVEWWGRERFGMKHRGKATRRGGQRQVRLLCLESLEQRQLLHAAGAADAEVADLQPAIYATGADAGGGPHVRVFDAATGIERFGFYAYNPEFRGGVRVALGDVTGDGFADIITAAGPGGGPHVRVFDGLTGLQIPGRLGSFMAYDPAFTGGVFVASADFGTGKAEIVTGAGEGGTPRVRLFWDDPSSVPEVGSFLAYNEGFRGGVRVATGDVDSDGDMDIITGAGPGGSPHVRVFANKGSMICALSLPRQCSRLFDPAVGFFAYDPAFSGGVYVASADVNGDQKADIITGAGAGGGPHVKAFSGLDGNHVLTSFMAYHPKFLGGVRVGADDLNGDGRAEIHTAPGPGRDADIRSFDALTGQVLTDRKAYENFLGGAFVAGLNGPQFEPINQSPVSLGSVEFFSVPADAPNSVFNFNGLFGDPDDVGTLVRFDTTLGSFGVELYDAAAPATVANFLNYVRDGDYDDSLIHGIVDDVFMRGGGYQFPGFGEVPADPAVANEALLANRRGRLAMAPPPGNPNGATSQWIINLEDNSAALDADHTVFGRVFPIHVVADIANVRTFDLRNRTDVGPNRAAFGRFPLRNYTDADYAAGAPITENNVVLVNTIVEDPSLTGAFGGDRELTLTARSSNPGLVSVSLNNGFLTLDYNNSGSGVARITVRATDVHGAFAESIFDVRVERPPGSFFPPSSDEPPKSNDCGCGGSAAPSDAVFAAWDG